MLSALFLLYILFALALIYGSRRTKGLRQKILSGLTFIFVVIPVCFIIFVGLFEQNMQRGEFFPELGEALMFVDPPDDENIPIPEALPLVANQSEYHFKIKHKYVGLYVVWAKFQQPIVLPSVDNSYKAELSISKDGQQIYKKNNTFFQKWSGSGLFCYYVPLDAPTGVDLEAIVRITGNIQELIQKYGPTELNIGQFIQKRGIEGLLYKDPCP